tara:strand:+ start:506 stop:988 length:483 start_codon:yes stop_codon:yes gene_type:complete
MIFSFGYRIFFAILITVFVSAFAPGIASGSESTPTLAELEKEIMCPTCNSTLEMSSAPVSNRIRAFIAERIEAGDTKSEIKDKLVSQFGESILAAPTKSGFNLLVWILPLVGIFAAGGVLFTVLRRWQQDQGYKSSQNRTQSVDIEVSTRIDKELERFDR